MPHTDPAEACSVALANLSDIPVWPQLPHRSFLENMYAQYSEGFPGVVLDSERVHVDRSIDLSKPLEKLYTAYLEKDLAQYAISPEYAAGFHTFLSQKLDSCFAVKGQVTGPISFGLVVTDQDRRPILYDEVLADALAKHLALKAAWQERELAKLSPSTIILRLLPYCAQLPRPGQLGLPVLAKAIQASCIFSASFSASGPQPWNSGVRLPKTKPTSRA